MRHIHPAEPEMRISRRDVLDAPLDALVDWIDALVECTFRIEILRQGHGHAADPAADVQDTLGGLQAAHPDVMTRDTRAPMAR